jgi:hypothetical protein
VALSLACQRDDLLIGQPVKLLGNAAAAFASSLIQKGVADMGIFDPKKPFWDCGRKPEHDVEAEHRFSLVLTSKGLEAIGIADGVDAQQNPAAVSDASPIELSRTAAKGTKKDVVVELLLRAQGANIEELMQATGWLPHTVRAALTGLRKKGHHIVLEKQGGAARSIYRIVTQQAGDDSQDAELPPRARDDHDAVSRAAGA